MEFGEDGVERNDILPPCSLLDSLEYTQSMVEANGERNIQWEIKY